MNKILKVLLAVIGFVLLILILASTYLIYFLPIVGPAPALTVDSTAELIQRGKYLANHVTVCMDCHSTRDWTRFSAPLAGDLGAGGECFSTDMGFPGTIYSANITPHNLKEWTDGEIFRAITSGVNKDGMAMFSVMPYHNYGTMDKEDIYSIIAYLRTLEHIESEVPERELDFPVNILVNISPKIASLTEIPSPSDSVAYGAYVINA